MTAADLAQSIRRELPYLRRYARALTGSQTAGDNYAVATLEAILSDRSLMDTEDTRIGLFRTFHAIWQSSGQPVEQESQTPQEARAQAHLRGLTPNSREALLLRTIEELRYEQIATIMQIDQDEAEELVQIAMTEMSNSMAGKVMVIEDETIIAMDLKGIVQSMGHDVTGIARTHSAAVELAHGKRPDLILADIREEDRAGIERTLRDHGVQFAEELLPVHRWSMACPALPTCGLALTEAERIRTPMIDRIAEVMARYGLAQERLSIRITGCPNGCARPYAGDIGLVGRMPGHFALYVGGDFECTRLNWKLLDRVPEDDVPETLAPLFAEFAAQRDRGGDRGEGFGDFLNRLGLERVTALVKPDGADAGGNAGDLVEAD